MGKYINLACDKIFIVVLYLFGIIMRYPPAVVVTSICISYLKYYVYIGLRAKPDSLVGICSINKSVANMCTLIPYESHTSTLLFHNLDTFLQTHVTLPVFVAPGDDTNGKCCIVDLMKAEILEEAQMHYQTNPYIEFGDTFEELYVILYIAGCNITDRLFAAFPDNKEYILDIKQCSVLPHNDETGERYLDFGNILFDQNILCKVDCSIIEKILELKIESNLKKFISDTFGNKSVPLDRDGKYNIQSTVLRLMTSRIKQLTDYYQTECISNTHSKCDILQTHGILPQYPT